MIRIRKALPEDTPAITSLLRECGLPTAGIEAHISRFLVTERDGSVIATAGLEIEGPSALLRSVAVSRDDRGQGLGIEIVRQALRLASLSRVETVYLLTETAAGFFPKLGFGPALRAEIDAEFPRSAETGGGGCSVSAAPMVLRDLSRVLEPYRAR
jgi:amino-acid N-acetyltransferase